MKRRNTRVSSVWVRIGRFLRQGVFKRIVASRREADGTQDFR